MKELKRKCWYSTNIDKVYTEQDMLDMWNEVAESNNWPEKNEVDDEVRQYVEEINADDFSYLLEGGKNLENIEITGTLGLWNGRKDIYPDREPDLMTAIKRCVAPQSILDFDIYFEDTEDGHQRLYIGAHHHDGTNVFELRQKVPEHCYTIAISHKMIFGA